MIELVCNENDKGLKFNIQTQENVNMSWITMLLDANGKSHIIFLNFYFEKQNYFLII